MSSARDSRIDAYIAKSAPFAQPVLKHLRDLVHEGCPEVKETLKWGAPSFEHAGKILGNMASFKAHCAFGFWHQGMEKVVAPGAAGAEPAMGSFGRITAIGDLPDKKTMLRYVRTAAKLNESGEPGRPRPAGKKGANKELKVPADLAAALKKNAPAGRNFAAF
ncbi:MAG: DUF1801 domain-containing protein, partial [Verrucomicrobiota bacterium]